MQPHRPRRVRRMTRENIGEHIDFHRYQQETIAADDVMRGNEPTAAYVAELRLSVYKRVPYIWTLDEGVVNALKEELTDTLWNTLLDSDIRDDTNAVEVCDDGSCKVICEACRVFDDREVQLRLGTNYCPVCGRRIRWS